MRNNLMTLVVVVIVIALLNVLGLIPPWVATAAGVLGEDVQNRVIDWIGRDKVMLDQAMGAAVEQEAALQQEVAANRVDHDLNLDKLASLRDTELGLRGDLVELGKLIEANETITVAGDEVWTPARIQEFTAGEVERHKLLTEQIAVYQETVQSYADAAAQAEAALVSLRQDMSNLAARRDLLQALVAQGTALNRQGAGEASPLLTQTQSDIQSLIESQRRANRIAQEMHNLQAPATDAGPLHRNEGQALVDYINSVSGGTASR